MIVGPTATTREDKWAFVHVVQEKLRKRYPKEIIAIGVYGSMARGTDGPFSDIEMWVIIRDGLKMSGHEFIWDAFKVEIDVMERRAFYNLAKTIDDGWAIKAGTFVDVRALYDPELVFDVVKQLSMAISDERIHEVMREFMIWEPYETMAKLKNTIAEDHGSYVSLGATDLAWQTAQLIGLANKRYYTTRARTFEESLNMPCKPTGYGELVQAIMAGTLGDAAQVYALCESLWCGLNEWFNTLGITYTVDELPF